MQHAKQKGGFWGFLKGQGKVWLLLGIALFGILLLAVGATGGAAEAEQPAADLGAQTAAITAYQKALEEELENLCEAVAGVSDCTVVVTLAGGYATTYATDEKGAPATTGNGNSEQALTHRISPPTIAGVGVVCRGGRDPQVAAILVGLISTTLGISSARVYIAGK